VSRKTGRGSDKFGWSGLLDALRAAFRTPTAKQKEGYSRYCHTLSAAALIGGTTLVFAESNENAFAISRVVLLALATIVFFLAGALLSRGDQ
jgi:hypothetical protein